MEWISIKERMPVVGEVVLVFSEPLDGMDKYKKVSGYLLNDFWVLGGTFSFDCVKKVTHWMPLPLDPEN